MRKDTFDYSHLNAEYVYIFAAGGKLTGTYKIGRSTDVKKRLTAFNCYPFDVHIVKTYCTRYAKPLEEYLHERFSSQRVKNEWFELSNDDIALFLRHDCIMKVCEILGRSFSNLYWFDISETVALGYGPECLIERKTLKQVHTFRLD